MNRVILQLLAATFCFGVVQALRCYECKVGFWNLCITSDKTCAAGEHCFSGKGKAAGFMDITMKGCLASAECNKTSSVNFPTSSSSNSSTTLYSMTKTCCNHDLCNSAPGLPGALQLALATVAAVFAANALV